MPSAVLAATEQQEPKGLARMQSLREFVESPDGQRLFETMESLRWFLRCHGDELARAGGLVRIGRNLFVVHPEFDDAVVSVAQAKARARRA